MLDPLGVGRSDTVDIMEESEYGMPRYHEPDILLLAVVSRLQDLAVLHVGSEELETVIVVMVSRQDPLKLRRRPHGYHRV